MDLMVNVDVDDMDKAVAFYRDAFGLSVGRRLGGSAVVEMLGSGAPIYLLRKAAGTRATAAGGVRGYGRHWTPVHLDFVVSDVQAAVERAVAAGATLESPLRSLGFEDIAELSDPFGHGFCLVAFRGRGYDEVADPPQDGDAAAR